MIGIALFLLTLLVSIAAPAAAQMTYLGYGQFTGGITTEWLDDGRRMRLVGPFTYLDPKGREWQAPAGAIVDGASIPRFAWPIIGGPFEGKYRNASVIHDVACEQKRRPWESVHEAFYYAMRASGVDPMKAQIMYSAVYHFGPRWILRVEIPAVPRSGVESAVNEIRSTVDRASRVAVDIRARPRSPHEIYTNQPEAVDVSVAVTPPDRRLGQPDFEKLKAAIEARAASGQGAMSLEEIREFRVAR